LSEVGSDVFTDLSDSGENSSSPPSSVISAAAPAAVIDDAESVESPGEVAIPMKISLQVRMEDTPVGDGLHAPLADFNDMSATDATTLKAQDNANSHNPDLHHYRCSFEKTREESTGHNYKWHPVAREISRTREPDQPLTPPERRAFDMSRQPIGMETQGAGSVDWNMVLEELMECPDPAAVSGNSLRSGQDYEYCSSSQSYDIVVRASHPSIISYR
jgi:hypothetical protein